MHLAIQIVAWVVALAWVGKWVESARGLKQVADLNLPEFDVDPIGKPALVVIVPARNEAAAIGECLRSLLAQDYLNLRIIAVNDRSEDGTGEIMDSLAAEFPERLQVIHIAELLDGWLGKTHAMAVAAREAIAAHQPDYLLFTDADIWFAPEILRRSLARAVATGADHFVTMPTTLVKSFGEGMLLSFLQVMGLWAVRPWKVSEPGRRDAIGVGAFNLIRTQVYLQLGGFDATPMEILEDLTLGRRVKQAGLLQGVVSAPGMVTVHWAPGLFGVVNGMTKNLFAVFKFRPAVLMAAAGWLAMFCVGPVLAVGIPGTRLAGTVALVGAMGMYVLSGRVSRISGWYGLFMPVSGSLLVYSMLRSMVVTLARGGVTWRGTFYSLADLRKHSRG